MKYAFFLGSNPALSAAECWRVLDHGGFSPKLLAATDNVLLIETPAELPTNFLSRLGGTDRIGILLAEWPAEPTAEDILAPLSPLPDKWILGVSCIGMSQNTKKLAAAIKKAARAKGSRLKFVLPGRGSQLNTAQLLFNDLCRQPNSELTCLRRDNTHYLIRTIEIQDIAAYELRDTKRPARNAKVGMLPPKLAQIMLNLAHATTPKNPVILDPFCGAGTILQEGWLLGYKTIGSDASETMTAAAQKNLEWLHRHFSPDVSIQPELRVHDVQYPFPKEWATTIDAIVTEPHMGRPLASPLPYQQFQSHTKPLLELYRNFFRQAHSIVMPGGTILFLLPAIRTARPQGARITPLPQDFLDEISQIGYRMKKLLPEALEGQYATTERGTIIYGRPDAIVSRELTLWEKH